MQIIYGDVKQELAKSKKLMHLVILIKMVSKQSFNVFFCDSCFPCFYNTDPFFPGLPDHFPDPQTLQCTSLESPTTEFIFLETINIAVLFPESLNIVVYFLDSTNIVVHFPEHHSPNSPNSQYKVPTYLRADYLVKDRRPT